jgi:MFS family permease
VVPLVALSALSLGASVELAALIAGLTAVGQLLGDLPASWVASRLGEKRAITLACCWDAFFLAVAYAAGTWWSSLLILSLSVLCFGLSGAVFGLARQSYVTEIVSSDKRARALSSLAGAFRIGYFIGPLAGSGVINLYGLPAAYIFAASMSLVAAIVTLFIPDLPARRAPEGQSSQHPKLFTVLRENTQVFLTLGTGVLSISLIRAVRQAILPLWSESLGFSASATSLVFAVSMGIDMCLFFPGGWIMDRFGKAWVAVPTLVVLGLGLLCLPLANNLTRLVMVAVILGLGNGFSAGVVMVMGSATAPVFGRTQFLAGFRLCSDIGNALGPVAIAGLSAIASLAVASSGLGVFALLGAYWLYWSMRHTESLS